MIKQFFKRIFPLFVALLFAGATPAQENENEAHIQVALRMVGHQILLLSGDSTSRVLPIEKNNKQYNIRFENDFQFNPEILVANIDSVIRQTKIGVSYRVAVISCENEQVVYSYEMGISKNTDIVPCLGRLQPKACYFIRITLLDSMPFTTKEFELMPHSPEKPRTVKTKRSYAGILGAFLILLLFSGAFLLFRKKSRTVENTGDLILLGTYQFNLRNMELVHQNKKTELTGKETALLNLLHTNVNKTLEKDWILKEIWGDEGDYVGRTLDVYISKLRKKLEADPSLKIINIRGVGYKLVIDSN
jgi:hypothetical protein